MELEVVEGELSEDEETFLLDGLKVSGEESLGMVRRSSHFLTLGEKLT